MGQSGDFRVLHTAANCADYERLFCDITEAIWPPETATDKVAYIAKGTPGQRALFVTTLFARLVDNGGFAGFFGPAGFYSPSVAEGLQLLQAQDLLDAFLEGLNVFTKGVEVPAEDILRQEIVDGLSDRETELLDSVDARLYQGSSVEASLFPFFKRYVDAHPQEFFRE